MANVEDKRNFLRKAGDAVGQFLGDMDQNYANAAYRESIPDNLQRGHALAIREIGPSVDMGDELHWKVLGGLAQGGLTAANVASRYALPLGGVTLAGKGLYDLTAGMNEQTSGTLMP